MWFSPAELCEKRDEIASLKCPPPSLCVPKPFCVRPPPSLPWTHFENNHISRRTVRPFGSLRSFPNSPPLPPLSPSLFTLCSRSGHAHIRPSFCLAVTRLVFQFHEFPISCPPASPPAPPPLLMLRSLSDFNSRAPLPLHCPPLPLHSASPLNTNYTCNSTPLFATPHGSVQAPTTPVSPITLVRAPPSF